jgi:hypothetical protein
MDSACDLISQFPHLIIDEIRVRSLINIRNSVFLVLVVLHFATVFLGVNLKLGCL